MGVDTPRAAPPLPAPTETDSTAPSEFQTELATDVSKPGDENSSYSLPEDGTPVTIKTRGHKPNRSQTSLLIEYFEGGNSTASVAGTDRKPSVRVRLTPSKNRRNDHIQITQTKSYSRKASLTRKSASQTQTAAQPESELLSALSGQGDGEDAKSMSSYASATEESNVSRNPIEVEIDPSGHHRRRRPQRPASPLIPTRDSSKVSYQHGAMSDISVIPTDSFLDGSGPSKSFESNGKSSSRVGDALAGAAVGLAGAAAVDKLQSRSRTDDKERVSVSKSRDKDRSERKHKSSKSRTSSGERESSKTTTRRRSSRSHQDSVVSAADSSVVSSGLTSNQSYEGRSVRSGASKSSINNPRLLETVEDAIRRLILPELTLLKREQSRRDRRSSVTSSGTSASREEYASDRRKSGASDKHALASRDSISRMKESRDREARHDLPESPVHSFVSESVDEVSKDVEETTARDHDGLKKAAAAAALGGLGAAALHEKSPNIAREQRRRRRAEAKSRSSEHIAEQHDPDYLQPTPPMPLMSEINPSEITRTSILSAETDRPHSASEEMTPIQEVSRGVAAAEPSTPTAARSPTSLHVLGTRHANISQGDLRALPRNGPAELDDEDLERVEHEREIPSGPHEDYDEAEEYEMSRRSPAQYDPAQPFDQYGNQVVPAPLKYTPYQPERRGLSPIPSVSGYTEGGSEVNAMREPRVTGSFMSSPDKSPTHDRQVHSPNSVPSNMRSREFDRDDASLRSSGGDYRNTQYTEDSDLGLSAAGHAVHGVGANPKIVHTPLGVESNVASLVDGSVLTDSALTGESELSRRMYTQRDSMGPVSDEENYGHATPSRRSYESQGDAVERDVSHESPTTTRTNPYEYAEEYELDQYGRKVPRSRYRQSPTASEAAITAGAVGAAAAAIKAAQDRSKQPMVEETSDQEWTGAGVQRNKSFKERTMDGHRPANTPSHSVDRLDEYDKPRLGASGMPDVYDPLPEIGYGYDDDMETNPSVLEGRLDGGHDRDQNQWSGDRTPTAERSQHLGARTPTEHHNKPSIALTTAAGAAALATAAAMAENHRHHDEVGEDEWRRTSDERKRDTLITNPYEGTSPIANLPDPNDGLLKTNLGSGFSQEYQTRSPIGHKIDEGYISQGPNRTPDHFDKGKGPEINEQSGMHVGEDPFYTSKHTRHMSGMSQAMGSPLYDAATGTGIDRIENKDIIALMQHLMVRDAQRSARDTEILVTLVRAASEMRDKFDAMEKIIALQEKGLTQELRERIADTEDVIITEVKENTDKTVRNHIGGPRPYPGSGARSLQAASQEDLNTKKSRNLLRRAFKGLTAKGNNDLTRIEDMLNQLLSEVDVLKAQTARGGGSNPGPLYDEMDPEAQYEQDRGYEPDGHAGTSTFSQASQSGHLSLGSRGPSTKLGYERKFSDHRISTVHEADEGEGEQQHNVTVHSPYHNPESLSTPRAVERGASVPVDTPPETHLPQQTSLSNENTPKHEKGKKHRSNGSSGWFPKISRWSATTASSSKGFRSSKDSKNNADLGEFHPGPSRSGSDLASYADYPVIGPEGADELHTGFSELNLHQPEHELYPSAHGAQPPHPSTYMTPEHPKYQAHRNSLNLQHPQPRSGQPFKAALESRAEAYDDPTSPRSVDWAGSSASLARFPEQSQVQQHQPGQAAQHEQQQYWNESPGANATQSAGPPRPPKEPLDKANHTPPRPRISHLAKSSPIAQQGVESGYGTATYNGSPKLENRNLNAALGVPNRRPSGPRAMTPVSGKSAGSLDEEAAERRRKRDTFGTVASQESETF